MDDRRWIDLETKIAHQEMALEALQQTSYEQQKTIEKLESGLKRLAKLVEGAGDSLEIGPANEKPPHY